MRLHHLTVTAFGPFAGSEHIDFEKLNEAGLFLLTGATGAGKSSLLDAVCFALYGTVPGVRGVKALKSQHAPAQVPPEVVLDFSVQGRRFVVRRIPEWTRPKKRGDGPITEKASASILETTHDTEHHLSGRAAEVGHLVTDLMGMNAAQFQQVALLPQGEFQTFLRASSQERHDVLQHLFRTDRFGRIEEWVNDRSRLLKERAAAGESTVRRILDTLADRATSEVPDHLVGDLLPTAAAEGQVLPWVAGLLATAHAAETSAGIQHDEARSVLEQRRRSHEQAARQAERRSRRDAAHRALHSLEETTSLADQARRRLSGHERATRCSPLLAVQAEAVRARDEAAEHSDRALLALTEVPAAVPLPDEPSEAMLSETVAVVRRRVARLEALLPRERAADDARRQQQLDRSHLRAAEEDLTGVATRAAQIPAELASTGAALAAATARAVRCEAVMLALDASRSRRQAAVELAAVRERLVVLEDAQREARDRVQDARDRAQALLSLRLAGMAAELAGDLAPGVACQVCGAREHPLPALPADDAVTDADQALADTDLADCVLSLDAAEVATQHLRSRRDALAATAGEQSPAEAATAIGALEVELRDATEAQLEVSSLDADLHRLRSEQEALGSRQAARAVTVAGLHQSVAAHERTIIAVAAEVAEALGDQARSASVRSAVHALTAALDLLTDAHSAMRDLASTTQRADALKDRATTILHEHGFARAADVADALLTDEDHNRLETVLREREATKAHATAVLEDPALSGIDDEPVDLGRLRVELTDAEAAAADAARALALHEDRVQAMQLQLDRLTMVTEQWAPVRDDALRAESMSRLVRGMGHDNHLQMRLSAYVLATRLDQVVAAANERLSHMRDQRYLLQRTGRAEHRSAQAGLGLEIVDQWTGDVRAPTTLSGGETFVVSLSLALGLADVVTHETGGTEIETLFVDEGFGTLDADTLDDVMDRLDGLRAGGRTVGVVSHVTELRSRIPTQVHVEKGRAGSAITLRTLVG